MALFCRMQKIVTGRIRLMSCFYPAPIMVEVEKIKSLYFIANFLQKEVQNCKSCVSCVFKSSPYRDPCRIIFVMSPNQKVTSPTGASFKCKHIILTPRQSLLLFINAACIAEMQHGMVTVVEYLCHK